METLTQTKTETGPQTRWRERIEQAYRLYQESITRYIRFLVGGSQPEVVEDLLADTFVNALRYGLRHEWTKEIESAWLYRIARNICIDYLRKRQRRSRCVIEHHIYGVDQNLTQPFEAAADLVSDTDGTHDPERIILAREALADTLEKIAPENRLAVILTGIGVPSREIAEVLHLSPSAIKMRVSRSYKLVRQPASQGA